MPRRRGFFRRLIDAIRPAPARPPAPPQPPQPPEREPPAPTGTSTPFRAIWDHDVSRSVTRQVSRETGYSRNEQFQLHQELFASMYLMELDPAERNQAWHDYLRAFVTNEQRHDWFFREWGMDPRDFDWQAWRAAMGYGRRKL